MAIIIDDGDVVDGAFDIETATNAPEVGEALANEFGGDVEIKGHSGSGGGVANVVNARRMRQAENTEVFRFVGEAKFAGEGIQFYIADEEVGLAGSAVGEDGAFDVGNDGLHVGFIEAEDGGTVKRNAIDELGEGVLDVFERGVLVEMFAIDGGDDGNDGSEQEKTAIAFVCFHNEIFAAAKARGGASLIDATANNESGIEVRGRENAGYE